MNHNKANCIYKNDDCPICPKEECIVHGDGTFPMGCTCEKQDTAPVTAQDQPPQNETMEERIRNEWNAYCSKVEAMGFPPPKDATATFFLTILKRELLRTHNEALEAVLAAFYEDLKDLEYDGVSNKRILKIITSLKK